ncbi:hypothetical protein QBC39DRAFT_374255 [Podospora conica]|nr:hypothetical protein QBC39DRAFT_374255 [Schizothecium conicum]
MASRTNTLPVHEHLKSLYAQYRRTADIDDKGRFFSPSCLQICRPNPAFCANDRETIVGYLHQVADKTLSFDGGAEDAKPKGTPGKSLYTIRPLTSEEAVDFATDDIVAPVGTTSAALRSRAEEEGWQGMRVDLWDDDPGALLVKVQYWWRVEDGEWAQILHDIVYLGPRDGTEGSDGAEVLEE